VPGEPSVRHQDDAWAALRKFFALQENAYGQLRKTVAEAAKPVGGAPVQLEQALSTAKDLLAVIDGALSEPTSEAGIQALARAKVPSQTLPAMLEGIREMAGRLQDVEVRNLYGQLRTTEAQAAARDALARYVEGQKSRGDLLAELQELHQVEVKPPSEMKGQVVLTARFGRLRAALEGIGVRPAGGWGTLGELPDDAEVTIEVRHDAEP
jgi:hypothetical protein